MAAAGVGWIRGTQMGARILAFVAIVLAGACTLTSEPLTRDTRARPADYDSWLAYVVAGDHRATT